jgi:hypothetical protein
MLYSNQKWHYFVKKVSMSNTVLPLERVQYLEAAGVLARAFHDDPVVVTLMKGLTPEERKRY